MSRGVAEAAAAVAAGFEVCATTGGTVKVGIAASRRAARNL